MIMYYLRNLIYSSTQEPTKSSPVAPITPSQDELRTKLRFPLEKKPDAYKNINSSSIIIITDNGNLKYQP